MSQNVILRFKLLCIIFDFRRLQIFDQIVQPTYLATLPYGTCQLSKDISAAARSANSMMKRVFESICKVSNIGGII